MDETKICNFGEHLMLDGYMGNFEKLNDRDLVFNSLKDLPQKLGMKTMIEPIVAWADPNDIKDPGGWSGIIMIIESHISIHTFPHRRFVSIDVYTCRNGMDVEFIENYFKEVFELEQVETNFVKRGTKYPVENIC